MSLDQLEPKYVHANGIEFAYFEVGSGALALCLHGFPDTAYTWRYLLSPLADAGFRAVAPFMRGYAPTGLAPDGSYELGALVSDVSALHDALGANEEAVLIGHDWGAEAAYGAAALEPERWRRLVTIGVPPLALDRVLFSDYDQLKRFFYLFFLKTAGAQDVVARDGMAFLDRLWRDWSPGFDPTDDLRHVKESLSPPAHLAAAIAYYQEDEPGMDEVDANRRYRREHAALLQVAPQPTLYLHGSDDGSLDARLVGGAQVHLSPNSRIRIVDGAGHFVHLERPQLVNDLIVDWVG